MAKFNATISFDDNKLTLAVGTDWAATGEDAIVSILDPTGTVIYQNDGYLTNDFSYPDVDYATSLVHALTENSNGDILQGKYVINCKNKIGENLSFYVLTITYCLTLPLTDVDIQSSCLSSTITATDNTDYDAICADGTKLTATYTRGGTLSYPVDIEGGAPDDVSITNVITTVTPIYTHIWEMELETFVEYNLTEGSKSTGDVLAKAEGTIKGGDTHNVVCLSCICNMYDCIKQVVNSYANALGVNPRLAETYRNILVKVLGYINLYQIAERCGEVDELENLCDKIVAALSLVDCACCDDTDEGYAQLVSGIIGTSSSIIQTTNQWYSGDGAPASSLGVNGDFYLNIAKGNGDIYKKVDGSWVFQINILGDDGADGDAGFGLLWSDTNTYGLDITDVSLTELTHYNMPISAVSDGDELVLKLNFTIHESGDRIGKVGGGGITSIGFRINDGDGDNDYYWNVVTEMPNEYEYRAHLDAYIEAQFNIYEDTGGNLVIKTSRSHLSVDECTVLSQLVTVAIHLNQSGNTKISVIASGTGVADDEVRLRDVKLEYYKKHIE